MQPELAPETLLLQRLLTIRPQHDESLSKDRHRASASGCRRAADGVRDSLQSFLDNEAEELAAAMVGYRYLYDDFRDESVASFISSRCTEPG